jgi:hypothetical protein
MSNFLVLNANVISDERGILSVVDDFKLFEPVRFFWITGVSGVNRGGHRHKKTRQALISIRGVIDVYMCDANHDATIKLDRSDKILIVEPDDWHTMKFYPDSILFVIASHSYDPSDYITDCYKF